MIAQDPVLEVRDLRTYFHMEEGVARAVDGVSFAVGRGQTLGLVGESGCGKSVSAFSIMRLVPDPPGRIEAGQILLKGRDLIALDEEEMRRVRGDDIAMIFPRADDESQPGADLWVPDRRGRGLAPAGPHAGSAHPGGRDAAVGGYSSARTADRRNIPTSYRVGCAQRVMIAMALSCNPDVLIADEPTTALDVTIQAQILALLESLQESLRMAIVMITHDLGVIAEAADQVAVMYAGQIVEYAETQSLFARPRHPYTRGLLRSIPRLDAEQERLDIIPGVVPDSRAFPTGVSLCPALPAGRRPLSGGSAVARGD